MMMELRSVMYILGPLKHKLKYKPLHEIIHTLISFIFQINSIDVVEITETFSVIRTNT